MHRDRHSGFIKIAARKSVRRDVGVLCAAKNDSLNAPAPYVRKRLARQSRQSFSERQNIGGTHISTIKCALAHGNNAVRNRDIAFQCHTASKGAFSDGEQSLRVRQLGAQILIGKRFCRNGSHTICLAVVLNDSRDRQRAVHGFSSHYLRRKAGSIQRIPDLIDRYLRIRVRNRAVQTKHEQEAEREACDPKQLT